MRFAILCFVASTSIATGAGAAGGERVRSAELASPAALRSVGAALTMSPDGTIWLSWVEPGEGAARAAKSAEHHHGAPAGPAVVSTLRFATFDAARATWNEPRTIANDDTVTTSSADFPQLAIAGDGSVFAVWTDGRGGARISTSHDRGASWSAPAPWAPESIGVEKFSFARLADGRVLAAWLDGRGRASGVKVQQLFTRIVGDEYEHDQLVDASVCDCCQTTLTPFLDGGALLGYRGRTTDEIRDIDVARLRRGKWTEPRRLNADEWKINACPINGPRLSSDGSRVAAAWFTGAGSESRVLVSYSADAGATWLAPLRIDRGHPVGHVDTLLLRDGAIVATWLETDGSLWLRRITPEFSATEPVQLAAPGVVAVRSVPRMALLRDYAGGRTSAEILLAYTRDGAESGVRSMLVTLPEGQLLAAERHCDCAPSAEELQGFAIRGVVVAVDPAANSVRVKHAEVPGVFEAGAHDFTIAPLDLADVQPQRQFVAHIQRRDARWRLYDIRLLESAR